MRSTTMGLLLLLAQGASAQLLRPEAHPSKVTVLVGETVTVRVTGVVVTWITGGTPFRPWHFKAANTRYIRVEGSFTDPWASTPMRITGLYPGKTKALFDERLDDYVDVTVRCGEEPAIQAAEPRQTVKTGEAVMLRALTPIAARTTFTWYRGAVGDLSAPIAESGPELAFIPPAAGRHSVWVMASTPCSTSTAQFEVEAWTPRRRIARH